jgi:divalent metal cation (Fe/Co/Zn/Cd) transporter
VILVTIWTIILIVFITAVIIFMVWAKRIINRINRLLDQGEDVAHGISTFGKAAASGIGAMFLNVAGNQIRKTVGKSSKKRR